MLSTVDDRMTHGGVQRHNVSTPLRSRKVNLCDLRGVLFSRLRLSAVGIREFGHLVGIFVKPIFMDAFESHAVKTVIFAGNAFLK